ncbi:MAG: Alpha/beta hydrolase family protein [Syntrophus sp. PtaU1.Bin208]|nr:MAG: Alpha/beta hydrolase family protein [Syntrophus sp. PtaU1.Bin208]
MREEAIFFKSGTLQLEGLYAENAGDQGSIVCHPHPLMGGAMENNVVEALISALFIHGFSTLRFNFRGVGRSEGTYDNGVGEQKDIGAAVSWLKQEGKFNVLPAGYSFGAWVSAKWLQDHENEHPAILIAPPINVMDFDFSPLAGKIGLVVCGGRDTFCAHERMKDIARQIGCRFECIPNADHFFFGRESELIAFINAYLGAKKLHK